MVAKFLYEINYLSFDKRGEFSIQDPATGNEYFILSNNNTVREAFFTDNLLYHLGQQVKEFNEDWVYAYCEKEIDTTDKTQVEILSELTKNIKQTHVHIASFVNCLWFVKDNSITVTGAIAYIEGMPKSITTANSNVVFQNSVGKRVDSVFNIEEILYACKIFVNMNKVCMNGTHKEEDPIEWIRNKDGKAVKGFQGYSLDFDYSAYNCVERAMVFLSTARKTEYLVYKIAFYIPILECLFATDKGEVVQKESERTAIYLEDSRDKMIEIYEFIKDAYEIRSTFLHGQKFHSRKITKEILEPIAIRLDEIIRASLLTVIMCDSENFIGIVSNGNSKEKIEKRTKFLKYITFYDTNVF